ncbi:MAG TPA: hypothetical protein PLZ55_08830 [bacterium]|nr:hypothetical protein [bacterium]
MLHIALESPSWTWDRWGPFHPSGNGNHPSGSMHHLPGVPHGNWDRAGNGLENGLTFVLIVTYQSLGGILQRE